MTVSSRSHSNPARSRNIISQSFISAGRELNTGDENTQGHANRPRASLAYFHPRRSAGRYRRKRRLSAPRTLPCGLPSNSHNPRQERLAPKCDAGNWRAVLWKLDWNTCRFHHFLIFRDFYCFAERIIFIFIVIYIPIQISGNLYFSISVHSRIYRWG